jgi:glutamyl-tRNA synthetase
MASPIPVPTSNYRGRLAPSPTGFLHVGHARTFWTAFQRARDAGGALVMRMEDLDPERSKREYADAAIEDLSWLGVSWQEGPDVGGPFAPYEQSKRHQVYLDAWRKLLNGGYLFPCRCSRRDLEAALAAPHENARPGAGCDVVDDEPVYPGTCRSLRGGAAQLPASTARELDEPTGSNWRFRVPDGEVVEFQDLNLGPQRFVAGVDFGDFIVWRRDGVRGPPRAGLRPWGGGVPSYQLACVTDDAAMGITEVVRGADLLRSTARQISLNRALGLESPAWYHCALAVDRNGQRLAKRHDALSLRALRQRGLTPKDVLSAELPVEA